MKPFYINVAQDHGKILATWYDGNKKRREKLDFYPTLFVKPSGKVQPTSTVYHTIRGEKMYPLTPGTISETRKFVDAHKDIENFPVYGFQKYHYEYISDTFPGNVSLDWDEKYINTAYLDIEVKSDDGFPEPRQAEKEVTAITIIDNIGTRVYGCGKYTKAIPGGMYYECTSEVHLLALFLEHWIQNYPDIVSGWNVKKFDMVYLINRIALVLGQVHAMRISPWRKTKEVNKNFMGRDEFWYEISGIAVLDMMELYQKYGPPGKRESYSLNYIAHYTLNEKKLSYSEYGSLMDLYEQNYELFIEYNIHDAVLVKRLEEKLKLIKLAMILAYDSKVNFEDVFYQTRMWDSLIYNYLNAKNIVASPNTRDSKSSMYEGAYVKEPIPGRYKWVVSFDYTSLYPSLMMQFNISPDTIVEPEEYPDDIRDFLSKHNVTPEFLLGNPTLPDFRKHNMVLAANGHVFRTDKVGFLPAILREMFADRQKYKRLYLEAKAKVEDFKKQNKDSSEVDHFETMCNLLQTCKKVCLNSAYGATGTPYFRYYDIRSAVAVTLSGQYAIKYIERNINEYFNRILETVGVDYVIAVDTDSIYLNLEALVKQVYPGRTPTDAEISEYLDRACKIAIQPVIKKYNTHIMNYLGAVTNDLDMKRESICNQAIWTAKKRYILSVKDEEGVMFAEPKIKMSGIEAVKSSTPQVCREKIKEALGLIINGTEVQVQDFILAFKKDFMKMTPEEIAFPRGLTEMHKYADAIGVHGKGSPIHVKGALWYNHMLNVHDLKKKYQAIKDGEKIKFLHVKTPNPHNITVIAFINVLPKEFVDIIPYVDYNMQFEKAFVDPLNIILQAVGWNKEPTSSLESFFT